MSSKSAVITVLIFSGLCICGSSYLLLSKDDNASQKQNFHSVVATATPETESTKYDITLNQKMNGTGSEWLPDKTFYFSDYSYSAVSAIEEASQYAQSSSEDYFLTYDENKATGQIVGVKFEKATEELERKYGSTTD